MECATGQAVHLENALCFVIGNRSRLACELCFDAPKIGKVKRADGGIFIVVCVNGSCKNSRQVSVLFVYVFGACYKIIIVVVSDIAKIMIEKI